MKRAKTSQQAENKPAEGVGGGGGAGAVSLFTFYMLCPSLPPPSALYLSHSATLTILFLFLAGWRPDGAPSAGGPGKSLTVHKHAQYER